MRNYMKLSTFSTFKKEYFLRKYGMHHLGRTTHKVHSFSAQTSQGGIKCINGKFYLRA